MSAPETEPTGPYVVPVGYLLGPFHGEPAPDGVPDFWEIRLGGDLVVLRHLGDFVIWGAAHGTPESSTPTLDALRETMDRLEVDDAADRISTLVELGVLAIVGEDGDSAVSAEEFAGAHAVHPLQACFGNSPDRLDQFVFGHGVTPTAVAPVTEYEVWQWAHLAPDLRAAAIAYVESDAPGDEAAAAAYLPVMLDAVRGLISRGLCYLDLPWAGGSGA